MTLLTISDLTFGWARTPVLDGLDLTLDRGEAVQLAGRNGTGKSTLLGLVAGHLRPSSGSVRLDGVEAHRRPARTRRWFMEAQPALYRLLTVGEQLDFYARCHGQDPRPVRTLAADLLGPGVHESLCCELSTGQAQKVWFAAALAANRAPLLLLDEPFSAIDDESVPIMLDLLESERAEGRAILLVTHAHGELLPAAWDRLVLGSGCRVDLPEKVG